MTENSLLKRFSSEPNKLPQLSPDNNVIDGDIVSLSLGQRTSEGILQLRTLMGQLIRGDNESKRLILNYFQEGMEGKYLEASISTDQIRIDNLKKQISQVDDGLSAIIGSKTSLVAIYKDVSEKNPERYQPVLGTDGKFNPRGLFDMLRFQKEIAIAVLSASEIASESAEIKAQTELVPLREELQRLTIREDKKTAIELSNAKPELVKSEVAKGEIRTSRIRGYTTPLIITIAEAPIIFLQAPVERLEKWMDEAKDKAVPISALSGAIAGPVILFTRIAAASPLIESWVSKNVLQGIAVGSFGGGLAMVSAWLVAKNILPALKDGLSYLFNKVDSLAERIQERRKQELELKLKLSGKENEDSR